MHAAPTSAEEPRLVGQPAIDVSRRSAPRPRRPPESMVSWSRRIHVRRPPESMVIADPCLQATGAEAQLVTADPWEPATGVNGHGGSLDRERTGKGGEMVFLEQV
jgi:hypothetical protein